jgi:hypothetical protein
MNAFSVRSRLAVSPDRFARHASTLRGVNNELFPLAWMLASRQWSRRPIDQWPIGSHLFSSWVFLLLCIPADIHRFGLLEASSRGFSEKSESLWLQSWCHDREWAGVEGVTIVHDSIRFEARLRLVEPLLAPLYRAIFRNRHRRLRKKFGCAP